MRAGCRPQYSSVSLLPRALPNQCVVYNGRRTHWESLRQFMEMDTGHYAVEMQHIDTDPRRPTWLHQWVVYNGRRTHCDNSWKWTHAPTPSRCNIWTRIPQHARCSTNMDHMMEGTLTVTTHGNGHCMPLRRQDGTYGHGSRSMHVAQPIWTI